MPAALASDAAPAAPRTFSARRRVNLGRYFDACHCSTPSPGSPGSSAGFNPRFRQDALERLHARLKRAKIPTIPAGSKTMMRKNIIPMNNGQCSPSLAKRNAANDRTARRPAGNKIAQNHEDRCAQHRTVKRTGTSNDSHYDHLSRKSPEQQVGRDELDEGRIERPGKSAERAGENERQRAIRVSIVADLPRTPLILMNCLHNTPGRRVHDPVQCDERNGDDHEREQCVTERGTQQGRTRDWQSVVPAGEIRPFDCNHIDYLRQDKGEHRVIDARESGG